jgi:hypothetical protein
MVTLFLGTNARRRRPDAVAAVAMIGRRRTPRERSE